MTDPLQIALEAGHYVVFPVIVWAYQKIKKEIKEQLSGVVAAEIANRVNGLYVKREDFDAAMSGMTKRVDERHAENQKTLGAILQTVKRRR